MRHWTRRAARTTAFLTLALLAAQSSATADETADWPYTEGSAGGGRFSQLRDINRDNVHQLQVAWTYRHGDFRSGPFPYAINKGTAFESTPIVVDGRLIFTTPYNRVIALDAERGTELWTYDPKIDRSRFFGNMMVNRGVAYWRAPDPATGRCSQRIFLATLDARLIALDAATGTPCSDFGKAGVVELAAELEGIVDPWEYNVTSPGTVVGDIIVVGSSIPDTVRPAAPPGDVQAFDVRTGERRWTFRTLISDDGSAPDAPGERPAQSGAANVWSTMTADLGRGWVFLPISTPSPDFYGVDRPGANLYSDSVVALEAATGRLLWHFQTVHHDLWDYDLAAPPVLVTVVHDGRRVDAVAQATKSGFLFVLDRETGKPLFPVEERAVPASDVPGEVASSTQPIPTLPPPLTPQRITESDLYAPSPQHEIACRKLLRNLRHEGLFTPPSIRGSLLYPFAAGGANWSGAVFDPARRRLVVPVNNLAHVVKLDPLPESNLLTHAARPLRGGLGGLWFLLTGRGTGLRYYMSPRTGRTLFAHDGVPCNAPPWGRLVAVDLDTGQIAWSVPAGRSADGVEGLDGYGPALATAGGLVFHAGTRELAMRVHDIDSGAVLATLPLPAGLHAGPITYKLRPTGKQMLVIAPGGHVALGSELGDYVIAYELGEPPAAAQSTAQVRNPAKISRRSASK